MTATVTSLVPFSAPDFPPNPNEQLYNYAAEQALLGALLLNNTRLEGIEGYLKSIHFSDPTHGRIFEVIQRLVHRNQLADPITLKNYFDNDEGLHHVKGAQYLIDLVQAVVSTSSVEDYAQIVYDLYLRRQLVTIGQEITVEAAHHEVQTSASTHIETAEKKLFHLAMHNDLSRGFVSFHEALTASIESAQKAFDHKGGVVGVTTGLHDLDKMLGGLHPSDLIILAGRPAMGKTALATNIAFNAAHALTTNNKSGAVVAFFSLEMSAEQLSTRLLASEASLPSDKIRRGDIRPDQLSDLVAASRRISQIPLYIDDTPAITVNNIRNKARRLQRQDGLGLIVIDYLQLIGSEMNGRGQQNRVQELSEITRSLKAIAKELDVPVIALSQLSRAVEQREDKRPQLADLRESGSIEQDADIVMFVYREAYYESRKRPQEASEKFTEKEAEWTKRMNALANKAEVIIAKQRHGPIGEVELFFEGSLTKFGNLDKVHASGK